MLTIIQEIHLLPGDRFAATNKSGKTFTYKYIGKNASELTKCAYIDLYNEDLAEHTFVESEWFRQRKIHKL